jgi:hypothetical protein
MNILNELEADARNLMERVMTSTKTALFVKDSWIHYDEFDSERQNLSTLARCFQEASDVYTDARMTRRFRIGIVPDLDERIEEMKKKLERVKRDLDIRGAINEDYESRRLRREYRDYH